MAGVKLSFRGDKVVLKRLKTLVPKLRKQALSKSIRAAMKPIHQKARSNAPKGATGQLRKSVRLRAMKRNRRGLVGMHVSVFEKVDSVDKFYGAFQEFGWHTGKRAKVLRQRGKWTGIGGDQDKRRMIPGKHFIEDAYRTGREGAMKRFGELLPREIDRIVTGG